MRIPVKPQVNQGVRSLRWSRASRVWHNLAKPRENPTKQGSGKATETQYLQQQTQAREHPSMRIPVKPQVNQGVRGLRWTRVSRVWHNLAKPRKIQSRRGSGEAIETLDMQHQTRARMPQGMWNLSKAQSFPSAKDLMQLAMAQGVHIPINCMMTPSD